MDHAEPVDEVRQIMLQFADETGLVSTRHPPRRYLWTDAHAVCNFLSLYVHTGDHEFTRLACALIDQVHTVLGRHRDDDPRSGWISGLSESEGQDHPTVGGLRIGKKLNERGPHDVFDERLEWDRDGQYFHYLTKWMHALCRASEVTGEVKYCRCALELAKAAHAGFSAAGRGAVRRMHWKMSIDLSRPLVASSGLHDPLDGYVTYNEIVQCATRFPVDQMPAHLEAEIVEAAAMIEGQRWETEDPLGIGGLLFDAWRVFQLAVTRKKSFGITAALVTSIKNSLATCAQTMDMRLPPEYRLAFRELGLSIGLHAVPSMWQLTAANPDLFSATLRQDVGGLQTYASAAAAIESFWRDPHSQQAPSWREHRDINSVMLATSLLPREFLGLGASRRLR